MTEIKGDGNLQPRRIAVCGAGIAGLSTAWLLKRAGHQVTLFEKESFCGGHSITDESPGYPVDLGFQVLNLTTYPHLMGFLDALSVETEESEMSFSLSMDMGKVEWASHSLGTIFAQRENLWKASFWHMIWDVVKFGRQAPKVLEEKNSTIYENMSMEEFLDSNGYSSAFRHHYMLPMCAAVWSSPNRKVLDFPVINLVRFWKNHHLLDLIQRPVWRVVKDHSRSYVNAIYRELEDVWINAEVIRVTPATPLTPLQVELASGHRQDFDAVVLATHTDTSLKILGPNASQAAREVLQAIPYKANEVVVHSDETLMPKRRDTWASWNFLGRTDSDEEGAVCVSYWANRLQSLPERAPDTFVTLNPIVEPEEKKIYRRLSLAHPVFSFDSYRAQQRLPGIQGEGNVFFAGAWCGYGFHEDGLNAGIEVAQRFGATIPWTPRATSPKISLLDRLCISIFDRFARTALIKGCLILILPNGQDLKYLGSQPASPEPGQEWRGMPAQRAVVRIFDCAFFRKILLRHDTGLGESYMDGDYEVSGDLGCLMAVATANAISIQSNRGALSVVNWLGDKVLLLSHLARSNTMQGSRANIRQHYDSGNAMYSTFLDETLTYSCGIHRPGDSLMKAQLRKLDSLIEQAQLKESDNVLEIGFGWGSLAIRAVQIGDDSPNWLKTPVLIKASGKKITQQTTGCSWTGISLSMEQLKEAQHRVKAAGLSDRITLLYCDYRELSGEGVYDALISCEMIEAVGHDHLDSFFATLGRMIRLGGRAIVQAISVPDDRYESYCSASDFIREHIFPGGHLPSLGAMQASAKGTGLTLSNVCDIGPHYAITLRQWRKAWERRRGEVEALGYSESFWRKYRFYFAYCEAAFDAKYIHDFQLTWLKTAPSSEQALATRSDSVSITDSDKRHILLRTDDPADPFTQVLLMIYFFLAGIAVSQSRLLWVTPLASAAYLALLLTFSALLAACHNLHPRLRSLRFEQRVWLSLDAVHLLHSTCVFILAARHALYQPGAWTISRKVPQDSHASGSKLVPDLLSCVVAGFLGFQLFVMVHQRLYRRMKRLVLHFTILLLVFGAAAYKAEHTALLACSLLGEASTIFFLLSKMQGLLGCSGSWNGRITTILELTAFVPLRLLPHAYLGGKVLMAPSLFSNKGLYLAAATGAIYVNIINSQRFIAILRSFTLRKSHRA